jgi:hypothetical protein
MSHGAQDIAVSAATGTSAIMDVERREQASASAQIYPDRHAEALAKLKSSSWHVPELTVARLIGFDTVKELRQWLSNLKHSGLDIAAFNAYEDVTRVRGKSERWWIIGHTTPKEAGIITSVAEQKTVTDILQSEPTAVRYGLDDLSEEQVGARAVEVWNEQLMELLYRHPEVFHLRSMLRRYHSTARGRPSRRDLTNAFKASIRGMLRRGIFSLQTTPLSNTPGTPATPAASEQPPSSSPPRSIATPAPTPHAQANRHGTTAPGVEPVAVEEPETAVPVEEQTVPRVIRLQAHSGSGFQAFSVQTRIAVIIMTQMNVSQVNQPTLLKALLELFGHTLHGTMLSRASVQTIQAEAGILANSAIAETLIERGRSSLQSVTACIDAASIGEDKFESCAFTWKADGKFVRIALPLLELSTGDDNKKQAALESACNDVINCYNACNAPDDADEDIVPVMTMYDIARICGHTVNDHAESVVQNKFIPWAKGLLEQKNGVWCSYPYTEDAQPDIITPVAALGVGRQWSS